MVLFVGALLPGALAKISNNMNEIISGYEIDNVELVPIEILEGYLPLEYAEVMTRAVRSLSDRIRALNIAAQ
jgi:hypothetical protein